ncbi:MAG: hypothetical protein EOP18_04815 [Rhizobiaceae bacterium]|nr:MAG: hypothetical protein EOP18_04815 [Rhizobiaceae bacterium]
MKPLALVATAACFAFSSAALAQDVAAPEEKKNNNDPDRVICKSEDVIGSRIVTKKKCMTAAQWKEQRRLSRMDIDRAQANRYGSN